MTGGGQAIRAALPVAPVRPRLVAYIMAGYPKVDATPDLLLGCQRGGASVVEIGFPYSDPLADGPAIQEAGHRALAQGMNVRLALQQIEAARSRGLTVPLVCMTSLNPLLKFGLHEFCSAATGSGVDGVLVPDLPLEEMAPLADAAAESGMAMITMVAPTTPNPRIAAVAGRSDGFLYCVSRTGVTGGRGGTTDGFDLLARARRLTDLPLALGFGVREAAQVEALSGLADAVAVGSRLIEVAGGSGSPADSVAAELEALGAAVRR